MIASTSIDMNSVSSTTCVALNRNGAAAIATTATAKAARAKLSTSCGVEFMVSISETGLAAAAPAR